MSNNKHVGFSGKGYYIALILCAAAIGITGYLYSKNASKPEEVTLQETMGDVQAGETLTEDIPVIATQPVTQGTSPITWPPWIFSSPPRPGLWTG